MAMSTSGARGVSDDRTAHAHDLKVGDEVVILTPEWEAWGRLDRAGLVSATVEVGPGRGRFITVDLRHVHPASEGRALIEADDVDLDPNLFPVSPLDGWDPVIDATHPHPFDGTHEGLRRDCPACETEDVEEANR